VLPVCPSRLASTPRSGGLPTLRSTKRNPDAERIDGQPLGTPRIRPFQSGRGARSRLRGRRSRSSARALAGAQLGRPIAGRRCDAIVRNLRRTRGRGPGSLAKPRASAPAAGRARTPPLARSKESCRVTFRCCDLAGEQPQPDRRLFAENGKAPGRNAESGTMSRPRPDRVAPSLTQSSPG